VIVCLRGWVPEMVLALLKHASEPLGVVPEDVVGSFSKLLEVWAVRTRDGLDHGRRARGSGAFKPVETHRLLLSPQGRSAIEPDMPNEPNFHQSQWDSFFENGKVFPKKRPVGDVIVIFVLDR
jgi:hypothetical protein